MKEADEAWLIHSLGNPLQILKRSLEEEHSCIFRVSRGDGDVVLLFLELHEYFCWILGFLVWEEGVNLQVG